MLTKDPRFLYRLILCMDANFRLKSRLRRNSRGDAPLYMGLGYQVHLDDYFSHLRTYVQEKDVRLSIIYHNPLIIFVSD